MARLKFSDGCFPLWRTSVCRLQVGSEPSVMAAAGSSMMNVKPKLKRMATWESRKNFCVQSEAKGLAGLHRFAAEGVLVYAIEAMWAYWLK